MRFELIDLRISYLPSILKTFLSIEDFLSKFKTLRLLLEGYKVIKTDDGLIDAILAKLVPTYSIFVSTLHSTREYFLSQGSAYKSPSFDAFCDSLIRGQDFFLHLGSINTTNTSNNSSSPILASL